MKYSIILATYNWPDALDLILANLVPQLENHPDTELIIANDGSTHDTTRLIQNYQKILPNRINHIWHEDAGFRKSVILNKAVAVSSGDYLLFLDGDCIPFPDYISKHKQLVEAGYFIAGNRVLLSKSYTNKIINNPQLVRQIFKWGLAEWILARANKKVNKYYHFYV